MVCVGALILSLLVSFSESAPQAFRNGRGQSQWHHNAFHDVRDSVRSDVRRMLHSRAEVNSYFIFFNYPVSILA